MKEVKEEVFGSRNSWLKKILETNSFDFFPDMWIATCRNSINSNKQSRYAILLESLPNNSILNNIKNNIPVYYIKFLKEDRIFFQNFRTKKDKIVNYEHFIKGFTSKLECKHIKSYAKGSKNSSKLSNFFREYMGKGYALTDIDFYFDSANLIIEEKGFVSNGHCYLGLGQCISFNEILMDIFNNPRFYFLAKQKNEYYASELIRLNCSNCVEIEKWGKMIPVKVKKINYDQLVEMLNFIINKSKKG